MTAGGEELATLEQCVGRRRAAVVRRLAICRQSDAQGFAGQRIESTPSADRTVSVASTAEQQLVGRSNRQDTDEIVTFSLEREREMERQRRNEGNSTGD